MLEQRRLDYLQAMGITQWMARKPLAHAPEPRWWPQQAANADDAELAAEPSAEFSAEFSVTAAETASVVSAAEVQAAVASIASVTPPQPEPATMQPQVAEQHRAETPEFILHFVRSALPVVWVCSDINEVQPLQNFVVSLQRNAFGVMQHVQPLIIFQWPYLRSSREDQSQPVALQALNAQWQMLAQEYQSQQQTPRLISFGETSQTWLELAGQPSFLHFNSLAELLHSADHKRQLWLKLVSEFPPASS